MKTIWLLFVLFVLNAAVPAQAGICQRLLGMSSRPLLYRSSSEFPETAHLRYSTARLDLILNLEGQTGKGLIAAHEISKLINVLAATSGLEAALKNPGSIIVDVQRTRSREEIPNAYVKAGVLSINEKMLALFESDDEFAAVVGHEFLHHSLAHDLMVAKMMESAWFQWFSRRSNVDAFPLFRNPNFFRSIAEVRLEAKTDANEREVDRALPELLANAGFDPWAIVDLNERLLKIFRYAPPIIIDGYTRLKFRKRTDLIRAALIAKGIEPKQSRSTDRVRLLAD